MTLRNAAIWVVIGVLLIGLYGMFNHSSRGANAASELTYSQLLSKVDAGQIKDAVVRGEQVESRDAAGKTYDTVTPPNQEDLIKRLVAAGADVDVKSTSPNIGLS